MTPWVDHIRTRGSARLLFGSRTHPNPLGTPYFKKICKFRGPEGPSTFQSNTVDMSRTHQILPRITVTPYCLIFCKFGGSRWTPECYALALLMIIPYTFNSLQWRRRVNQWFTHARQNLSWIARINTPTQRCHARDNQVRWLRQCSELNE